MKKLLLLSVLLILVSNSHLFSQDYMEMNKKNLRIEHQQKLNQIDSLSNALALTNSENQNLQSELNNAKNDIIRKSDSLRNINFEMSQLEFKLENYKSELGELGIEIDNLVKQNLENLRLIADKNLQIDSLTSSLKNTANEKNKFICSEKEPKYEDYGDEECEYIIRERNCLIKNFLINRNFLKLNK